MRGKMAILRRVGGRGPCFSALLLSYRSPGVSKKDIVGTTEVAVNSVAFKCGSQQHVLNIEPALRYEPSGQGKVDQLFLEAKFGPYLQYEAGIRRGQGPRTERAPPGAFFFTHQEESIERGCSRNSHRLFCSK
jgi:hypothetical protein